MITPEGLLKPHSRGPMTPSNQEGMHKAKLPVCKPHQLEGERN